MNQPTSNTQTPTPVSKASAITSLVFLVALGITIWLTFAEAWPVQKLIDIQAGMFDGSYYPKLTFMLTLIGVWLPLFGVQKIVMLLMKKK